MDIESLGFALKSETRRLIIIVLSEKPLSSVKVYRKLIGEFQVSLKRETIYKELEKLVDFKIIEKNYNQNMKEIQYELKYRKILIDLSKMTFSVKNNEN